MSSSLRKLLLCFAAVVDATVLQMDLPANTNFDVQLLALAVQGIGNIAGPRVWYNEEVFWTDEPSSAWFVNNWFTTHYGLQFLNATSVCDIVATLEPGLFAGVVIYDAAQLDASQWIAATMAGLYHWLPVTAAILADPAYSPCLAALPVQADLRGRWQNMTSAYEWALDNLMPACNKTLTYSVGHSHDGIMIGGDPAIAIGLDLPIQLGAFIFNLSPANESFEINGQKYPAYPEDAAMFSRILTYIDPLAGRPSRL
jgi:hypothetical protein